MTTPNRSLKMLYYLIYEVDRGAAISKKRNYHSEEKANAFMDSVCGEGEFIDNFERGGKRIRHKDGTSHYMHDEIIIFEDE
jgi:hypothetical protein